MINKRNFIKALHAQQRRAPSPRPTPTPVFPPPPPTPVSPALAVPPPSPRCAEPNEVRVCKELAKQLRACTEEKEEMSARRHSLMSELERSKRNVADLQLRREEAFVAMKARDERISLLEQQIADLQVQVRVSSATQRRLSAEIARLRRELNEQDADVD